MSNDDELAWMIFEMKEESEVLCRILFISSGTLDLLPLLHPMSGVTL